MSEFQKYKIWMIQEGASKDELIKIVCVGCGKVMNQSADFYSDNCIDFFCSKKCTMAPNMELVEKQRRAFLI